MADLTTPARFIGCDVGKDTIVVFDSCDGGLTSIPNQPEALKAFAARLSPASLVICEATGGYEAALLDALVQAGRAVHRADPRRVKPSSARSAPWAKPTRSMPRLSPATAGSATTGCRSGSRAKKHAPSCTLW